MSQSQQTPPPSIPTDFTRRDALTSLATIAAAGPMAFWSAPSVAVAQREYTPLNRYPRMVHEHFVRQVRIAGQVSKQRIAKLKTKEDAERHVKETQERIRESFGPEPERTPLNPRITGTVERDGYRIENIIFESRPGFPVTANIYVPTNKSGPFPGVVGTCGHSSNGKAAGSYQSFAQGLAKLGYICLIYDPIGQGERLQYPNEKLKSKIGVGVQEHLHAGNQQFLVGEFLGSWRAWDGIRALDYLLTRDDIDKTQVGVTGNSGGGTMTTWLSGVEDRWSMTAPSCFVTTFLRNMENELPADTEQCPPKALALGLDHCDFIAAMAPKPAIILAKEQDFFDVRGSEEAYSRLKHLYKLLGAEDNLALFYGPTPHGYSQENREAMYSWFNRATGMTPDQPGDKAKFDGVLRTAADLAFTAEPEITLEKDETLWCTPKGQVSTLEGTRTIFDFTRDTSQELAAKRKSHSGDALKVAVRDVLKLPKQPKSTPDFQIYRAIGSRGYPKKSATAYAVNTEPGIQAIVYRLLDQRLSSRPPQGGKRATLYVSHLSSDAELRNEELIQEMIKAEPDVPFFTCDVRGIGESMPDTCSPNSFHSSYGNDYFYSIHSIMLDRPYVGQKTLDVLRVLDWMKSFGHTEVHIVGNGWGGLPATFAAVLSDQVNQVTLKHALTSYTDLAETEHYEWPLSTLLPNVLSEFDLPDCYAALKSKNLKQIEPWGAEASGH
ncbi:alpha/beta hydrolase family protein [Thalassoglobus polymorphus]|uniref:Alpha/beta hydrolase family protein n=1 Tax=Thalassoglobus polymorphus TaxID=2527994 RepID=A0A517QTF7_9PLAN|nr:acetylxylan esterase [Thalassoglobus polymorphus]QDT34931.1 Alpha/beta hydrolase family protein [Thalassoglobus polymorphus]